MQNNTKRNNKADQKKTTTPALKNIIQQRPNKNTKQANKSTGKAQ